MGKLEEHRLLDHDFSPFFCCLYGVFAGRGHLILPSFGWPSGRYLRKLEAVRTVADTDEVLIISGTGELPERDKGIAILGLRQYMPMQRLLRSKSVQATTCPPDNDGNPVHCCRYL